VVRTAGGRQRRGGARARGRYYSGKKVQYLVGNEEDETGTYAISAPGRRTETISVLRGTSSISATFLRANWSRTVGKRSSCEQVRRKEEGRRRTALSGLVTVRVPRLRADLAVRAELLGTSLLRRAGLDSRIASLVFVVATERDVQHAGDAVKQQRLSGEGKAERKKRKRTT
jgi:hypothetical protein